MAYAAWRVMSRIGLVAPSSLMSSRWSRDNLVSSHPARLYDGQVIEQIELESLPYLVEDLQRLRGPCEMGWGHMGVFTWDIVCQSEQGPFVLQVPRLLDERGRRGRSKRLVPQLNFEHLSAFIAKGLKRFAVAPKALLTLAGNVPGVIFEALPEYHTITFGLGAIQIELSERNKSWVLGFGAEATADLLCEMIAALVYHYEPELDGGTAIADVCVNDGDFVVKRRKDGSFELRLLAARALESGIGPNLLLLYLVQLMAYEDWSLNDDLVGIPVLLGNPSLAFEGVLRGLRYRYRDLGQSEEQGKLEAERWIANFARSVEGRAYRPWAERFLAGALPPSFGADLRDRWWRLMPLQTKLGVLELEERRNPASNEARAARTLRTFLARLGREIGRRPAPDSDTLRINELDRDGLLRLLEGASGESREAIADELLEHWPYRSLDQLLAQVPSARSLRRMKSRLSFGRVLTHEEEGTLAGLSPLPKDGAPSRELANPELFNELVLDAERHADAVRMFPTFETFMDTALHDPNFGYYALRVAIGKSGHFDTHPEEMSPDYGKWMAAWAFRAWLDLLAHGELSETAEFVVIEFGAGNGRLARDFLDAVVKGAASRTGNDRRCWEAFAACVRYRIYERSAALREKQAALLGPSALVLEGDARTPRETLQRDFPTGLTGFVLSNELPDAFGVHKLILSACGGASVALVIPRVEPAVKDALGEVLAHRIDESNRVARASCGIVENSGDFYLDAATYAELMRALSALPEERRASLFGGLWFEETYVSASAVPELAAHLRANAAQYALALAAEDSGVVTYVNVHAARFISELASSLAAGFIVTLDYGDSTFRLLEGARRGDFPFRVYGEWQDNVPRPNDPYAAPGTQDLTADVNFTDFAHAAEASGLQVVHFGPERDITADALPELLRASAERDSLSRFLGNPLFKVLVLGKRPSSAFGSALASPLALRYREEDLPKPRRHAVAAIAQALRSVGSNAGDWG
ncbi:MAG TPA: SAM-dependent methyltransferase [Polyangiaceae bacterium]|nr:SAM-dependent methyltransferase [Polyangiaceae bacterium]